MKKVVFVCDKCGKIIQRDPISIVPVVLKVVQRKGRELS